MSEFDKYIVHDEPAQRAKADAWQTAIGLQDVDGLKVSAYLLDTAQQHIEGEITIDEAHESRFSLVYRLKCIGATIGDSSLYYKCRISRVLQNLAAVFDPPVRVCYSYTTPPYTQISRSEACRANVLQNLRKFN